MSRRGYMTGNLAGSLLLAHPSMTDPSFQHSVVLISAHSDEGAVGVILNRPLGKSLGEFKTEVVTDNLSEIPVFVGGPVGDRQIILSAWQASESLGAFKLYFGLDAEKAGEMVSGGTDMAMRAFVGYAGWGEGQLENELTQNTWVVAPVDVELMNEYEGEDLWRSILTKVDPELRLASEEPEDLSLN
jgi:putative transcriptional regulator